MEPAIHIPAALLFLPKLNPSGSCAVHGSGLQIHGLLDTSRFVAFSDEGHALPSPAGQHLHCVSPSSWQTPRCSVASLRDPTCIPSALSLLTPWIPQSPNQTPASHFPSWVSELRERRDSGTCLSTTPPGCCLPFVFLVVKSTQEEDDLL